MASKLCALIVHNSLINFRSLVRTLSATDSGIFAINLIPFKNEIPDNFDTLTISIIIYFLTISASMNAGSIKRKIGRNDSNQVRDTQIIYAASHHSS